MALSWNEIKNRAVAFSKEWEGTYSEDADAKPFLVDLYDPLTMPPVLVKAHNELDKAVDLAYRPQPFTSDANRMEFLFELYEKYTAGLFAVEKKGKSKKK